MVRRLGCKRLLHLTAAVLLFTALSAQKAVASEAHIVNISVNESYSLLMVSASLDGAFTEEIEEAFMSGMPVTFTFFVKLIRDRSILWDARENAVKIHKVVKYDSFAKEFNAIEIIGGSPPKKEGFDSLLASIKKAHGETLFSKTEVSPKEMTRRYLVLKNLPMVKSWMSSLKHIPLGNKLDYVPNAKYHLEVKAEMDTIKLTPPFNYIFFFVSFLNFDTEWAASSPFMLKQENPPTDRMLVRQSK